MPTDLLTVTCPTCDKTLRMSREVYDRGINCPGCHEELRSGDEASASETGTTMVLRKQYEDQAAEADRMQLQKQYEDQAVQAERMRLQNRCMQDRLRHLRTQAQDLGAARHKLQKELLSQQKAMQQAKEDRAVLPKLECNVAQAKRSKDALCRLVALRYEDTLQRVGEVAQAVVDASTLKIREECGSARRSHYEEFSKARERVAELRQSVQVQQSQLRRLGEGTDVLTMKLSELEGPQDDCWTGAFSGRGLASPE